MPWIAAAVAGIGSIAGGLISSNAAGNASNASQEGAALAVAEQKRQFDLNATRQQPWLTTGSSALNRLAQTYGLDSFVPNQPGITAPPAGPTGAPAANGTPAPAAPAPQANNDAAALARIRQGAQAWESAIPGNGLGIIQKIDSGAKLSDVLAAMNSLRATTTNPRNTAYLDPLIATAKTAAEAANQAAALQAQGTFVPGTPPATTTAPVAGQPAGPASPPGTTQPGNQTGFYQSPDYQFRLDQSLDAYAAQQSKLGLLDSGATRKGIVQRAGDLASGEFTNYANRLASLAGVGQTTATNLAAQGASYANNVGNIQQNAADNRASAYLQQGNTYANTVGQIAGIGSGLIQNGGGLFGSGSGVRSAGYSDLPRYA